MNADEIVRALRCVQEKHRNDRLLTFQTDVSAMARDAADMIESLQAQLDEYDALAAEYGIDGKTMLTLAKSQIKTAQDNIKLQEQLTASQRREKAAVEEVCRRCPDGEIVDSLKHYPCNRCKWRGPQAEKGENNA